MLGQVAGAEPRELLKAPELGEPGGAVPGAPLGTGEVERAGARQSLGQRGPEGIVDRAGAAQPEAQVQRLDMVVQRPEARDLSEGRATSAASSSADSG